MAVKNHDVDVSSFRYDPKTGIVIRILASGEERSVGTLNHHGYLVVTIKKKQVQVHRLAWRLHFGAWPERLLDHRDGNKLNNRIGNLRDATDGLNRLNNGKQSNNTTGYKGVYLDKRAKARPWRAMVIVDYKRHYLGSFDTPIEAAAAYDRAVVRLHGAFAVTNGIAAEKVASVRRKKTHNRAGWRGVTRLEKNGRTQFKAMIFDQSKHHFLGYFDTERQAAYAYDCASVRMKGSFGGRLNMPYMWLHEDIVLDPRKAA